MGDQQHPSNSFLLDGRVKADPEAKPTRLGTTMAFFEVAWNHWSRKKTCWFDCVAFEEAAEVVMNGGPTTGGERVRKGDRVKLVGYVSSFSWKPERLNYRMNRVQLCVDEVHLVAPGPATRKAIAEKRKEADEIKKVARAAKGFDDDI